MHIIPKIVSHFARKESCIKLGNINVYRDFSDVRDIATYYRQIAETNAVATTINLCSGELISVPECLELIAKTSGHTLEIVSDGALSRENEVSKLCGDRTILKSIVNSAPRHGFSNTIQWMLDSVGSN